MWGKKISNSRGLGKNYYLKITHTPLSHKRPMVMSTIYGVGDETDLYLSKCHPSTKIDYFPIPHNTLCLPPKFCITYCLKMLLGKCNTPRSI